MRWGDWIFKQIQRSVMYAPLFCGVFVNEAFLQVGIIPLACHWRRVFASRRREQGLQKGGDMNDSYYLIACLGLLWAVAYLNGGY